MRKKKEPLAAIRHTDDPPQLAKQQPAPKSTNIPLLLLSESRENPRTPGEDEKLQGLIDSIKAQGLLQPILVREIQGGKFEIVCGHRRFRAVSAIAKEEGSLASTTIPALVREMTVAEAREAALVENLQREDLTELDEARTFHQLIEGKGQEIAGEIAVRIGVTPQYVMRRARVAELPESVLRAWADGYLLYGHLEQLMRLENDAMILTKAEYLVKCAKDGWPRTVRQLAQEIDGAAIELSKARFDKIPCRQCLKNSTVQRKLFEIGDANALCISHACFLTKQAEWIDANFRQVLDECKTKGANGWRFYRDLSGNEMHQFYGKPHKKCAACKHLVLLMSLDGKPWANYLACVGESKCYKDAPKSESKGQTGQAERKPDGPRVPWHGEHFRERFLQQRLPVVIGSLQPDEDKVHHLALIAILKTSPQLCDWFCSAYAPRPKDGRMTVEVSGLVEIVRGLDRDATLAAIREATMQVVNDTRVFTAPQRLAIAKYLKVDLSSEWRLTTEYLEKKTKAEIMELGEKFGLWQKEEVVEYIRKVCKEHSGLAKYLKKSQLIPAIMESGVDLAGVVPDEILNGPNTLQDYVTSVYWNGRMTATELSEQRDAPLMSPGELLDGDDEEDGPDCGDCESDSCEGCAGYLAEEVKI